MYFKNMGFGRCFPAAAATFMGMIFLLMGLSFAEKGRYSFAKEATSARFVEYYDYIVAGGGAAGCALAATLSISAKVLLLERGGWPYDNPNVTNLSGFRRSLSDTSPNSASQQFVSTDGVFNHRARALGGGTAINGGFYSRAEAKYVQRAGWERRLVKESYEWVERKLVFRPRLLPWQAAVRGGLIEAGVLPDRGFTYEHLVGTKVGGTIFDENFNRHTAADLLEYANPEKITVYLHATVEKILFKTSQGQKPKAYGVIFRDSNGTNHSAYLNNGPTNEIILSAGALGSPQLLMLSGIGPEHQLKTHRIKVVLDHPMVGQGMADNPTNSIIVPSLKPVGKSQVQMVGISDVGSYVEATSDFLEQTTAQAIAQSYAKFINQTNNQQNQTRVPGASDIHGGTIAEKVAGPFSAGHMELQSLDPNDNPRVTFNYFRDPRDLEKCVHGMNIIKEVVESKPTIFLPYPFTSFQSLMSLMLEISGSNSSKHPNATYSMQQFCTDTVTTIWHYHGGCQVNRVVDRDYKVIGVDGLRVVDGSTFNGSPGTNPQATVMMLGRYVGQKILQERSNIRGNGEGHLAQVGHKLLTFQRQLRE